MAFSSSRRESAAMEDCHDFRRRRGASTEDPSTAISYGLKFNKAPQCGAVLDSRSWRAFTSTPCPPSPNPELFKEYSVTGHGGLTCAELSKGGLLVCNPLTGQSRALPPLIHSWSSVLHLNSSQTSVEVIVAGSSTASDEHLSRKVEVFDSFTSEWTGACDVPGPVFGLNEHQGGVCVDGTVLFIVFLGSGGRGVVGFDGKWVTWAIPDSCSCNTLQVLENNGKVYLFSERERGEHCIYELEILTDTMRRWKNVSRVKTFNVRGLLVYPELTCLGLEDGKPYIINTLNGDGVVYDMRNGHGNSRAANVAEFIMRLLKRAGAMSISSKIFLASGVLCNLFQPANAQQLTSNGNPVDPAPWLTSDTAKVTFVTALFAGGVGAAFIWKRFFRRPLTFSVDAGLEASPAELGRRRSGLDSVCPRIDEC